MALAGLEIVEAGPPLPSLSVSIVGGFNCRGRDDDGDGQPRRDVGDLVVSLSSDKTDEATVPTQVTIPDGETTSAAFTITGQLDGVYDPDETVTITASPADSLPASDTLLVTNIDPAPASEFRYDFGPSGSAVAVGFELVTHTIPAGAARRGWGASIGSAAVPWSGTSFTCMRAPSTNRWPTGRTT